MSEIVDQVLDSVINSEPSEVVIEDVEETVEETVEESSPVKETVEESSPVKETVEEVVPVEEKAPVEKTVEEATPVEETAPEEETRPIEQVVNEIQEILTEPVVENNSSDELTDDLKQRIAELDYLRECCGNWVGTSRVGARNFLTAWTNKNITVDFNVNYEDTLGQLEKLPEIVKLWVEMKVNTDSNHFKNIQSYTLDKPLFNGKNLTEKVEVVEKLINLLINCANRKMSITQVKEFIDNLY